MPAMTTCPVCGFNGPHGFNQDIPYTVTFFHGKCRWYIVSFVRGGYLTYTDYETVIKIIHTADNHYHSLWVDYMLDMNPRRKHVQVYKRANLGACTSADRRWLENRYQPSETLRILERSL